MPDLLLELFSEEIPARMQAKAADDLKKLVTGKLVEAGLVYEGARAFVTPRRLALTVQGIPAKQPDVKDERKGPKVGAPEQAIAGFVKAAGLKSINDAKVQSDKKGDFYVAVIDRPGKAAIEVIAKIILDTVKNFPWPKSMRWGSPKRPVVAALTDDTGVSVHVNQDGVFLVSNDWLRWVRPLHSIVATFGPETEDPEIVKIEVDGIKAGDATYGHRFMAPAAIKVKHIHDYEQKLEKAKVVLDPARRQEIILTDAKNLAFAQGFELVEDAGLLAEVAGLVEWPVVLMGSFDKEFLSIPQEVIRATIRNNQKCFVVRDPKTGKLANKFILTANVETEDGGKVIVAGNERVIRARLSDAKFFYETDLKTKLEDRLPKFEQIVFLQELGKYGTQAQRIERISTIAEDISKKIGAEWKKVERAVQLCKADLLTDVVGEFPELQGLMGRYYAAHQNEDPSVSAALEEHYKPIGPNDRVPTDKVSIAVALADKCDLLLTFWAIDQKPTGSKDPFALRRAALGVIRIILENKIRLRLLGVFEYGIKNALLGTGSFALIDSHKLSADLLAFFAERLKIQLRDQGARHDLVDAVFALGGQDDLFLVVHRVEALGKFLATDDGKNLLAGVKRASNILGIEEKKDKKTHSGVPDKSLLKEPEEEALASEIARAKAAVARAIENEDFEGLMSHLARLRPAVDAFFDKVKVNADDAKVRENRLKLLNEIREATRAVADFSKIEG